MQVAAENVAEQDMTLGSDRNGMRPSLRARKPSRRDVFGATASGSDLTFPYLVFRPDNVSDPFGWTPLAVWAVTLLAGWEVLRLLTRAAKW